MADRTSDPIHHGRPSNPDDRPSGRELDPPEVDVEEILKDLSAIVRVVVAGPGADGCRTNARSL